MLYFESLYMRKKEGKLYNKYLINIRDEELDILNTSNGNETGTFLL